MATVFPVLLNWLCALFLFGALGSRPLTERSAANDAGTEDTCSRQVPPALQDLIRKRFPSMRMPSSSDIAAANRIGDLHDGGTGCTAVAEGDFDGDNLRDYAILLATKSSAGPTKLVVARRKGKGWSVQELKVWTSGIQSLYVSKSPPGEYQMTEAIEKATEPGEVEKLIAKHDAVLSGVFESSAVLYALEGDRWLHVWISD